MKIEKICLYCGATNNSINYTCDCNKAQWTNEYRSLDIRLKLDESEMDRIRSSFYKYHLDSPEGMLQYAGLPHKKLKPHLLDTVGITPLHHFPRLSEKFGCKIYLKNEGNNPSGCFKDRETMMCLLNSIRRNLKDAVIYSSGNAAASAAIFAQKLDFHLITFVAGDTYPEKIDFIRNHGSDVIVTGDEQTNFEEGFRLFASLNANRVFSDVNYDNWSVRNPYRVQGDKTTTLEIVKQLSENGDAEVPDYVIVPTANGSCLAGMWKGFKELHSLGLIDKLPKMISVGIKHANPVFKAVQENETKNPVRCDLKNLDADDAEIGSIILAEEGYDSIEAAKAVLESNGLAVEVHRSDMVRALIQLFDNELETVEQNDILPEPASVTSLAAIEKLKKTVGLKQDDKVVSLLTGHGLKAKELVREMLAGRADLQVIVEKISENKREEMQSPAKKTGRKVVVKAEYDEVVKAFEKLNNG